MTTNSTQQPAAIVTGAARGIGLACAQWFLAHGYRVAMLDVDNAELLKASAALDEPARVLALPCDVSSPAEVIAAVGKISTAFGRIDALVNNAGVAVFKPLLETTFDEWRQVMAVNLDGAFLCTQACAPVMLKNSKTVGGYGAVVNIASISGLRASAAGGLRHQQGRHHSPDQTASRRAWQLGHSRQRDSARPGRYRHGQEGAQRSDSRRLRRCHPAGTLRYTGRNCRRRGLFMQPGGRLH